MKKRKVKRRVKSTGHKPELRLEMPVVATAQSLSKQKAKSLRDLQAAFGGKTFKYLVLESAEGADSNTIEELEERGISTLDGDDGTSKLKDQLLELDDGQFILFADLDNLEDSVNWKKFAATLSVEDFSVRPAWVVKGIGEKAGEYAPIFISEGHYATTLMGESGTSVASIIKQHLLNFPEAQIETKGQLKATFQPVKGPGLKDRLRYLTSGSLSDWKKQFSESRSESRENPLYRFAFFLLLAVSFFGMTILSQNAGISGDEYRYIDQAERVYNYYASFGEDKAAVSQTGIDPQHYNAQTFDNLLFTVQTWIGLPAESFGFRHFWNAVVGWLALLLTGLIALRLGGGYRMAFLVSLLLLLSPRFLGHSYNNHRDIPMAATVLFAFYWMIPFLRSLPRIDYRAALWVVIGIASAYSLRLGGGVLLTGYLVFFAAIFYALRVSPKKWFDSSNLSLAGKMAGYSILTGIVAWIVGLLFWPFGLESPIAHSLEVLDATGSIGVSLRQVFEGEEIFSSEMPWYYVLRYMQLTIPLIVLGAMTVGIVFIKEFADKRNLPVVLMVVAAILLPLYYACFGTTNHYGGWRHFIFVYPFIVLFAGMGLEGIFRKAANKYTYWTIWAIVGIGLAFPVRYIVQNHPYEYIYYNELIGGTGGAAGFYELDYSMNSLRETSNWLIENVVKNYDGDEKLRVASNDRRATLYYFRDHSDVVDVVYTRYYEKSRADWDYAVFYSSFISPFQIRNGLWPPFEAIYTVQVDGAPVGAVVRRPSKSDYKGQSKLDEGRPLEALEHFADYLDVDPTSVEVWTAMADAYMFLEEYEAALSAAEIALDLLPGYGPVLEFKGGALLNLNRNEESVEAFDQVIDEMPHHYIAHYYKAAALFRMQEYHRAIDAATLSLGYNPNFQLAYRLLAECYAAIGDRETADRILRTMEERMGE